jgi:hypothetical protein
MSTDAFVRYQSSRPALPVAFEYPAGWDVEESAGTRDAYTQVQIYGPKSVEGRMRTYLVVRALVPDAEGGSSAGLSEFVAEYRRTMMPELQIQQERDTEILGGPAKQLEIAGSLRLPWRSRAATDVPVKGQRLFFERGGRLYELAWLATPEASPQVANAFGRLRETLTINP